MPRFVKKVKVTPKKKRRLKNLNCSDRGMKGQLPNRQTQILISRAWRYFRRERLHGGPLFTVQQVRRRVCECLRIGAVMASKYRGKGDDAVPLTPGKDRNRVRPMRQVDDFTRKAMRNLVVRLHRNGIHFTLKTLLQMIRDQDIDFHGRRETLRKVLHDVGFFFVKRGGTVYLKEMPRIAALRYTFLKLFKKYVDDGWYDRKYLDETWIFEHGSGVSFMWSDGKWDCQRSKKMQGGARYIVAHVGGEDGFVEDALLVYHSKSKPQPGDDYHGDMNGKIFSTFMEKKVLPHTEEPSVYLMDNASYHKFQDPKFKRPTKSASKKSMINWLALHEVQADMSYSQKDLFQLCLQVEVEPVFPIVRMIHKAGHAVLFTPPYHFEYQPIELVWGIAKRYFDAHIDEIPMKWPNLKHSEAVILLWEEAVNTVTKEVWKKCVRHVEDRILKDHSEQVGEFGEWTAPKPIIIALGADSDDSDVDPDDPDAMEDLAKPLPFSPSHSDNGTLLEDQVYVEVECAVQKQLIPLQPAEYYSVDPSVSLAWSMLPSRVISVDEIHSAISTITSSEDVMSIHNKVFADMNLREEPSTQELCAAPKGDTFPTDKNNNVVVPVCEQPPQSASIILNGVEEVSISSDEDESTLRDGYQYPLTNIQDIRNLSGDTTIIVKFGVNMTALNLLPLLSTEFLNDDIIYFYLKLVQSHLTNKTIHVFTSNFYDNISAGKMDAVKNWTKNVNIFECQVLLIPVHLVAHWCLCIVEPKAETITYYDSMGGRNVSCLNTVLDYLSQEWNRKRKGHTFLAANWKKQHATGICQQPNLYDCGVFVCYYGRMVCEGIEITESTDWLPEMRIHMLQEITSCSLQPLSSTDNVSPLSVALKDAVVHHWENKFPGHGIININQTCFAASILQALFNCAPFVAWLRSDLAHRTSCQNKNCISCVMYQLHCAYLRSTADPSTIIQCLSSFWPQYKVGQQQDTHEFLSKLLENLQSQFLERYTDFISDEILTFTSPVEEIFGGQLCTTTLCCVCKRQSVRTEPFLTLSISVMPSLIVSCKEYFGEEYVQGYKCINCHAYVKACKRTQLDKAPEVLVLHLKRFSVLGEKLKMFVTFLHTLNMSPFMSGKQQVKYNLRGVVSHIGTTPKNGHYIAVVQCPDQQFRKFNDSEVHSSSLMGAQKESAYMLFYERDPRF